MALQTHTFKSTEDRFGLKSAALADVAYKDDTAMKSLKAFLAAEETKILITNGLFQTEEKFQNCGTDMAEMCHAGQLE